MTRAVALIHMLAMTPAAANVLPALPLQPGQYASEEFDCKDAPYPGLFFYDGRNIGVPQAAGCVSRTVSTSGAEFVISTECTATRFREIYRVLTTTRVERADMSAPSVRHIYRWCGPVPLRK
jgi:hypothetical protein